MKPSSVRGSKSLVAVAICREVHASRRFLKEKHVRIFMLALAVLIAPGFVSAQETVSPHGLTFTLDPARTAPGTVEVEVGTLTGGSFDLPWIFKFTADAEQPLLRNMEWTIAGGVRGGPLNVVIRRPLYSGRFNIAVSPRLAIPLDGSRPLPGLAILASFPCGLNGFTVNGEINQTSGVVRRAVFGDYARTLGKDGLRSKVTLFAGMLVEKIETTSVSTGQGFAYRIRPNVEFEATFRQFDLARDRQLVVITDLVLNLGRVRK